MRAIYQCLVFNNSAVLDRLTCPVSSKLINIADHRIDCDTSGGFCTYIVLMYFHRMTLHCALNTAGLAGKQKSEIP